jgi:mono/diheme cytochrome c family protein
MKSIRSFRRTIPMKARTILMLVFAALIVSACDRSRNDKGYEYFPDMFHSPAYKTYSDNPALPDDKTMLEPPEGSIPIGFTPYPYDTAFESRELAGRELENPFTTNEQLLEQGKELYAIFCMNCHGASGNGDGFLHTSGKYPIRPSTLIEGDILSDPSGEIYHVITKGWGVMGAHESMIRPDDRWKIVMFVEEVLQQQK